MDQQGSTLTVLAAERWARGLAVVRGVTVRELASSAPVKRRQ